MHGTDVEYGIVARPRRRSRRAATSSASISLLSAWYPLGASLIALLAVLCAHSSLSLSLPLPSSLFPLSSSSSSARRTLTTWTRCLLALRAPGATPLSRSLPPS
eukprot:1178476-Rhodomonas_salina.1